MNQLMALVSLVSNVIYDTRRYYKYSSAVFPPTRLPQLEAKITARYHNIEKGLSLSDIRLGFGKEKIELLFSFLDTYVELGYDQTRTTFQTALSILNAYIAYHEKRNYDVSWIKKKLASYQDRKTDFGGTYSLSAKQTIEKEQGNFEDLALNRYSIRNFSDKKVPLSLIEKAAKIAQKAPSVCNRQSGRLHVVRNPQVKKAVLNLHKGNGGFGHLADTVIVVTSDVRTFTHVGERYQSWIDGSLFGMTLIYALHSLGLATCTLNWSVTKQTDSRMHDLIEIPEHENILFLIAVGHYPEKIEVAKSMRKNVSEIMRIIE